MSKLPFKTVDAFSLTGLPWRERFVVPRTISDLAGKSWMEGAVPVLLSLLLASLVLITTPEITGAGDRSLILRQFAELGFLALALTIVMVGGGIDLSVGSITGLSAMASIILFRAFGLPVPLVILVALLLGVVLGSINGFLIAIVKTRPFITTLVTLLAFRAMISVLQSRYAADAVMPRDDDLWLIIGQGNVAGFQTSLVMFLPLLLFTHLFLTRSRWGWWVTAVGSDRRSARRNGVPTRKVAFLTYVASGLLCGLAGLILAARQGSTSDTVASGYEIAAVTAVVLGGVSLKGGRGSAMRAAIGALVVALIAQAVIRNQAPSGTSTSILAAVLICFAVLDAKWNKNRTKVTEKLSMVPASMRVGPLEDVTSEDSKWRVNFALSDATPIGVGQIEGAEDCVVDDEGRLYCGDRRGWVWRFSGDDLEHGEIFARTGGFPLGHALHPDGRLFVAVGGIGLCEVSTDGEVEVVANQTRKSRFQIFDDSAIRFADDLDIAPDGTIYFTDASSRIDAAEMFNSVIEYRPSGRVFRYDPSDGSVDTVIKNYLLANGLCTSHDGQSILVASTGLFRVDRLWISGPRQGELETVVEGLPGMPDNINRSSDGHYWMSYVGMRTPSWDLLLRHGDVRRRMTKELPKDDWLNPQFNVSCIMKFTDDGRIIDVLWDGTFERHPMVTSMSERHGHLWIGGIENNRIGRVRLPEEKVGSIDPGDIPAWTGTSAATRTRTEAVTGTAGAPEVAP